MVLGIQVVGLIFGVFMIYYSFLNYKRDEFRGREFGLWVLLWTVLIVVALFPTLLDPIQERFGFIRILDVLIVSGFLFLIATNFYTYTITRKTQRKMEQVVREVAMIRKK